MVIVTNSDLSAYECAVRGHVCLSGLDIAKDVIVETVDLNSISFETCVLRWT